MMGTGPPPGCSALALVSTWLCPLSASQRAAEWGSIETNSFCRTQLMGLPRPGRKGAAAGLWLLILRRKHARNLPPGICPMTITNPPPPKPTSFSVHTWIHPKIPPHLSPSNHPPTRQDWLTGEWLVVVRSLVTHKEAEKKREVAQRAAAGKYTGVCSDPWTPTEGQRGPYTPSTNRKTSSLILSHQLENMSPHNFTGPIPIDSEVEGIVKE